MQIRQSETRIMAVIRRRAAQQDNIEESQDCGGAIVQHAGYGARFHMHGRRAGDIGAREMLHQAQVEGQVLRLDAHLVEREDEASVLCLQVIVGIRNAFGDSLEDVGFAKIVLLQEDFQLFERNIGIDGHAQSPASARGSLNSRSSRVTATSSMFKSKRPLNSPMTCSTSNSGADAPAERPVVATPCSIPQSMAPAFSISAARLAPARRATSTSRMELEELAEPITNTISQPGAVG